MSPNSQSPGGVDRGDLLEQAEAVQEAVEASMYHPVAHGEAKALQNMIEQFVGPSLDKPEAEQ